MQKYEQDFKHSKPKQQYKGNLEKSLFEMTAGVVIWSTSLL